MEVTPLDSIFTVVEGIKAKQKVTVLGTLGKITKADGGCGSGATSTTLPTSNYVWDPTEMKSWLTFCNKTDRASLLATGVALGCEAADVSLAIVAVTDGKGTAPQNQIVGDILMTIAQHATANDILRQAIFGDTDMLKTNASPTPGVLNSSMSLADYTAFDGVLKQLFAIVAADATRRYTIDKNALSTYALQDALADGQSSTIFKGLRKGATPRLKSQQDVILVVSESIWNNQVVLS